MDSVGLVGVVVDNVAEVHVGGEAIHKYITSHRRDNMTISPVYHQIKDMVKGKAHSMECHRFNSVVGTGQGTIILQQRGATLLDIAGVAVHVRIPVTIA